jgi:hypothetical protein
VQESQKKILKATHLQYPSMIPLGHDKMVQKATLAFIFGLLLMQRTQMKNLRISLLIRDPFVFSQISMPRANIFTL